MITFNRPRFGLITTVVGLSHIALLWLANGLLFFGVLNFENIAEIGQSIIHFYDKIFGLFWFVRPQDYSTPYLHYLRAFEFFFGFIVGFLVDCVWYAVERFSNRNS